MNRRPLRVLVILSGLSLVLGVVGLYAKSYPLGLAASLMLVGFVPGYGVLSLVPTPSSRAWLVRGFAALALSYAISIVLLMVLVYLTGAVTPAGVLIAYGLLFWSGGHPGCQMTKMRRKLHLLSLSSDCSP
jgi:uncharacterized membrane protein